MKSILIIGMGEFGKRLAYRLKELKNEVCIADVHQEIINIMANDFENAYTLDCMQKISLAELGVDNFDICIVAVGENFQASLEITSHLKELGAKYIISKAASDIQAKFLKMAGADQTIYPEKDIADKVAMICNAKNLLDYIQISNDFSIFEIEVPNSWVSKTIRELDVRNMYNFNIIAIRKNGVVQIPTPDYVFEVKDRAYVFGSNDTIKKIQK